MKKYIAIILAALLFGCDGSTLAATKTKTVSDKKVAELESKLNETLTMVADSVAGLGKNILAMPLELQYDKYKCAPNAEYIECKSEFINIYNENADANMLNIKNLELRSNMYLPSEAEGKKDIKEIVSLLPDELSAEYKVGSIKLGEPILALIGIGALQDKRIAELLKVLKDEISFTNSTNVLNISKDANVSTKLRLESPDNSIALGFDMTILQQLFDEFAKHDIKVENNALNKDLNELDAQKLNENLKLRSAWLELKTNVDLAEFIKDNEELKKILASTLSSKPHKLNLSLKLKNDFDLLSFMQKRDYSSSAVQELLRNLEIIINGTDFTALIIDEIKKL